MGDDRIDTRLLTELTVQSQDLNSDAVRITQQSLGEFGEEERERSGHRLGSAGLVAGLVGAGLVVGAGSAMAAGSDTDVQALQTAASIENLAVNVYQTAAGLPFIKSGNTTVAAFIAKMLRHSSLHDWVRRRGGVYIRCRTRRGLPTAPENFHQHQYDW
jgi:hypothetical protein